MILSIAILADHAISGSSEVYARRSGNKPAGKADSVGWRSNGGPDRVEVFRSPLNREDWVTRDERAEVIRLLKSVEGPFTSSHGYTVLYDLQEGINGWFAANGRRRVCRRYTRGQWVPLLRINGEYGGSFGASHLVSRAS